MADKDIVLSVNDISSIQIKPTFEGVAVALAKISVDNDASDLKGLIQINSFVPGPEGIVNVPIKGLAEGTGEATVVFKYADADPSKADVEGWGKSTKTLSLTINAAAALARLIDVSTPLTMDLWASQPLTFKVVKGEGEDENDITPSVDSVTVTPASIDGKFEFTADVEGGAYSFKSIQSSTTEVVTATAKLIVAGTHDGVVYSLEADVVLNTNINDGSIPTNRFNVEVQ
ncbi:hypothetical protein PQD71_gp022 [Kosakonia phage Kc263]|uniref:Uncharacterized protein n=1 Tax=Kosakonia phage Kc263 TaxID=2863194 RepID=A0AAE7WFL4_9CAUD|nr:hypothetical protein PQD71_gp022 [Kosakonia phage Kc263]QYN79915.1 hypothetical protein [Kosakonia phage Kc263]